MNTTANFIASVRKTTLASVEKLLQIPKTFAFYVAVDGAGALKISGSQIDGITSRLAARSDFDASEIFNSTLTV